MTDLILLATVLAKKRLLIFDLDGTIADTSLLHEKAFKEVLTPLHVLFDYRSIAGMTPEAAITQIFETSGARSSAAEIKLLVNQKRAAARRLIEDELSFITGAEAFIRCANDAYEMALCSSGSRETVRLTISKLGLSDVFQTVVTAEDVISHKPHPDGFLQVLRTTGQFAENTLVFEDSKSGVESASRAGLEVIQISVADDEPCFPGAMMQADWFDLSVAMLKLKS